MNQNKETGTMNPLNQSLLTLMNYIKFSHTPGEPIEVEMIVERLLELNLLSQKQVEDIYEVLK